MAFGGLKGTLRANAASITNPFSATGSVSVAVGDLVYAVIGQQTAVTATACSDNLGNTYNLTQTGVDAGTSTAAVYYSRVTNAGTLTSVSFTTTASTNNVAAVAAVIEGPFAVNPLDANPTYITSDNTSPFTAPASGTLNRSNSVVMSFQVGTGSTATSATSPNTIAGTQESTASVLHVVVGYQLVSATTSVAPAWTAGSNPTDSVLGTNSFKGSWIIGANTGSYSLTGAATTNTLHRWKTFPDAGVYSITGSATTNVLHKWKVVADDVGNYTLTGATANFSRTWKAVADAGSYSVAGTDVGVLHKKVVSADSGSYAIAGSSADLLYGFEIVADAGSYSITGIDVGVLHKKVVSADSGGYSITGSATAVLHGWEVVAGAGSYVLNGSNATLTKSTLSTDPPYDIAGISSEEISGSQSISGSTALSENKEIIAAPGSYVISGQAASLEHHWVVAANAGTYAINGQDASLEHGWKLAADAGTYGVNGHDVSLERGFKLAADAGSYSVTGQAVNFPRTWRITAEAGIYSITGSNAALIAGANKVLLPDAGAYSVSGQASSLLHRLKVLANTGAYSVSGQDSAVLHGWRVAMGAGSYSVTGQAVGLLHNWKMPAEAGSYSIAGQDSQIVHGNRRISVDAGSYLLSGSTVSLFSGVLITPADRMVAIEPDVRYAIVDYEQRFEAVPPDERAGEVP